MAGEGIADPRMMSIQPRIRYNTIGGVNGPLVILENVRMAEKTMDMGSEVLIARRTGQIP